MTRAQRRHDNRRIKSRFYEIQKTRPHEWRQDVSARSAGIFANHGKTCSCFMCGNPRRFWGDLTVQEKRAELCRDVDQVGSEEPVGPEGVPSQIHSSAD